MRRLLGFGVLFQFLLCALGVAQEYDLVLRNGRVADGAGNPLFHADVAVKAGRVVSIGRVAGRSSLTLDVKGLVVAPGFIDVHTHADEVAEMPSAENFVRMGVTTIVVGNCGSSALDIAGFFNEVQRVGPAVNVATLIGHNDVRRKAMGGAFDRPPTAEEMERMKRMVREGMKAGALGLSTGLIYLPGTFSTTEEIVELAKEIAPYRGIYTSHMRHEDARIFDALNEVVRVAREAKVRAEVSHIKLAGPSAWGQSRRVLDFLEAARAEGLDITQDQYAYTASSTTLSQLVPDSALEGGKLEQHLDDPAEKERIIAWMKENLRGKGRTNYAYAVIAACKHDPRLNGLNIPAAAKLLRGSDSLDDQIETVLTIQRGGGASGVFHGMSEEDLKGFMRHPNTMVACDSGLRKFGEGVPHPRGYGNNPRVLGTYVREQGVLRLEDAVRKMTSLPATVFGMEDRGQVREGFWADLTVFDPATVEDKATYESPHQYPAGIVHVIVNGRAVLGDGQMTKSRPGHCLRK